MKFADDLVLLTKEQAVLQGRTGRLAEIGRRCGLEINVEKTKVMRISRHPLPIQITIKKNLENAKYSSRWVHDVRCTR